jgi:phosphate transport system permease protein
MSTTTTAPAAPAKPRVKNALTAGHLSRGQVAGIAIGALVISTIVFGLLWMLSGDPLYTFTEQTGKLTLNFNWGAWLALTAALYLVGVYFISRQIEGPRQATNRFISGLLLVAFVLAMVPLLSLIFTLVVNGLPGLIEPNFWMYDASRPGQRGALNAIIGTLWITGITSLIAVPIGIFTAIYLVEYGRGNWLSKLLNFFVDVMTGVPSIVAGLFAFALFMMFTQMAGGDITTIKSGFVGSIALMVLMIPTVVRSAEEMIRLVPMDLREASYALGVTKWRTIVKVVLPTCLGGLVTGVLLAIARVIGETAPLMVAAGMTINMNVNPFQGAMSTLPTLVYQQWKFTGDEAEMLSWAGALALLLIVVVLNIIGRIISYYFSPKKDR